MSRALSCVVMYGSSQPYRCSQPAAYSLARLTNSCSSAGLVGS